MLVLFLVIAGCYRLSPTPPRNLWCRIFITHLTFSFIRFIVACVVSFSLQLNGFVALLLLLYDHSLTDRFVIVFLPLFLFIAIILLSCFLLFVFACFLIFCFMFCCTFLCFFFCYLFYDLSYWRISFLLFLCMYLICFIYYGFVCLFGFPFYLIFFWKNFAM